MKAKKREGVIYDMISEYKLDIESVNESLGHGNNSVMVSEGTNEGYYITVINNGIEYIMRIHSYDETMLTLGVMLTTISSRN